MSSSSSSHSSNKNNSTSENVEIKVNVQMPDVKNQKKGRKHQMVYYISDEDIRHLKKKTRSIKSALLDSEILLSEAINENSNRNQPQEITKELVKKLIHNNSTNALEIANLVLKGEKIIAQNKIQSLLSAISKTLAKFFSVSPTHLEVTIDTSIL